MGQILLIDDSEDVFELVKLAIGDRFRVSCATSAAQAEKTIQSEQFDLILLDIMLPDKDGFKVCEELRNNDRTREIPILFLSAKSETSDKVLGFSLGADDYIVKPFDRLELRARIEAKLKKSQIIRENLEMMRRGKLLFHVATQQTFRMEERQEKPVDLTSLEFKLLFQMARNEGQVMSRDQLLTAIRGADVHVLDRTVDRHIAAIRKKLGPISTCIESVHGVGYRFISP